MSDLDEQCAEAMGWVRRYSPDPTIYAWEKPNGDRVTIAQLPHFSTDLLAARSLFDALETDKVKDRFLWKIAEQFEDLPLPYPKGAMPPGMWHWLMVTPEQLCVAFLKTMRYVRP